jgi:hypothetical protein
MVEEAATDAQPEEATLERSRSTIAFPYGDLDDALEVVRAIHSNAGNSCSLDQLGAYLGHDSVKSGAFRTKVNTARMFGAIETSRNNVALTQLGHRLIDPQQERQARAEAFLRVPLYNSIFERYRGRGTLPPDLGLENELVSLGVAQKQKDKARQAFQRSAGQAGFFAHGRNRLVMPAGAGVPVDQPDGGEGDDGGDSGGNGGGGGYTPPPPPPPPTRDLHPFIEGLLETLPKTGEEWSGPDQEQWLATAKNIFALIYKNPKKAQSSNGNN